MAISNNYNKQKKKADIWTDFFILSEDIYTTAPVLLCDHKVTAIVFFYHVSHFMTPPISSCSSLIPEQRTTIFIVVVVNIWTIIDFAVNLNAE